MRAESRYGSFRGLSRSLGKINAPAQKTRPVIFAQSCADGNWIVYDLEAEQYVADTPSYDAALAVWGSLGLSEPSFADARQGARGLHRSWASLAEETAWIGLMWLPLLAVVSFPLCIILSIVMIGRYLRTRRAKYIVWALVALVPTLPWWRVAWAIFSPMVFHRDG